MLLALDISTSCIGYSIFNKESDRLVELNFIKFGHENDLFEKLDTFKRKMEHILQMKITRIAIEEPLQKFQGKFSSAHTISILNFFNGMISSFLYNHFKVKPLYYNVRNARSIVFPDLKIVKDGTTKHQIWECVRDLEPQVNWIYGVKSRKLVDENYDICDSYVVGKAHISIFNRQIEMLKNVKK